MKTIFNINLRNLIHIFFFVFFFLFVNIYYIYKQKLNTYEKKTIIEFSQSII